jgi:putative nucleotidyltransferase with HDIG domain
MNTSERRVFAVPAFFAALASPGLRVRSSAIGLSFIGSLAAMILLGSGSIAPGTPIEAVSVGKVAERDIVADRRISYLDEKATKLRAEAEARLVLPVFELDARVSQTALDRFESFRKLVASLASGKLPPDSMTLRVQSAFPGLFSKAELAEFVRFPNPEQLLGESDTVLRHLLARGIWSIPANGLEPYNSDYFRLMRRGSSSGDPQEVPAGTATTMAGLPRAVADETLTRGLSRPLASLVALFVQRFAVENAWFSADASERNLDSAKKRAEPVIRVIAPGEKIIRKGTVVSEADADRLDAARLALSRPDWGRILGGAGMLVTILLLGLLLLGKEVTGKEPGNDDVMIASIGAFVCLLAGIVATRWLDLPSPVYVAMLLPSSLVIVMVAVLSGQRFASLYAVVLAVCTLAATDFDARAAAFTLISANAAIFSVRRVESRMDLVRSGLTLGLLEAMLALVLTASSVSGFRDLAEAFLWGGLAGFTGALLPLSLLPVLELALNTPTRFRLIELSDLNAPAMKRLLATAPGTYSHSVAVGHLAEAACREIGADPLLARVGGYYHDLGKSEQPEYFSENQAGYNRHDDINPRLSVTVIRSHVKLGVEKARVLGLPEEVVDIIAEHHGNGIISFFYDRANREDEVAAEDFSYPGPTPGSREAGVVMLADSAEAASRSLKKPTPGRLEGLIGELILDRVRQSQLDRCDLTFRDLDTIKSSFARTLAGQLHARIEYPRVSEQRFGDNKARELR